MVKKEIQENYVSKDKLKKIFLKDVESIHFSLWGFHKLMCQCKANSAIFHQMRENNRNKLTDDIEELLVKLFKGTMLDPFIVHSDSNSFTVINEDKRPDSIRELYYGAISTVSSSGLMATESRINGRYKEILKGGGYKAWGDLLKTFSKDPESCLNSILNRAYSSKWIDWTKLSQSESIDVMDKISELYDTLNDVQTTKVTQDICMRQLVLLCVEALFKESIWRELALKYSYDSSKDKSDQEVEEAQKQENEKRIQDCKTSITHWVTSSNYLPPKWTVDDGSFLGSIGDDFNSNLLANIKVGQAEYVLKKTEKGDSISPMHQIIAEYEEIRLFLLTGDTTCGSTISGAGKTTALKELCSSMDQGTMLISLNEVYGDYGIYLAGERRDGETQLMTYLRTLEKPYMTFQDIRDTILLLDGLDEVVDVEGVRRLCFDLKLLMDFAPKQKQNFKIVISSKLPPEALAIWNAGNGVGLSNIAGIFRSALVCRIQTMSSNQKDIFLANDAVPASLREKMSSPFLLRSYREMMSLIDNETKQKMSRWISETRLRRPPKTPEAMIYRMLIAQISRWYKQDAVNDMRGEGNAIFLLFTLPAIAHRQVITEIIDPHFYDYLQDNVFRRTDEADNHFISDVLDLTVAMTENIVPFLPAYQGENAAQLDVLYSAMDAGMLSKNGFDHSPVSTILDRTRGGNSRRYANYRFSNTALRFELSSLHVANVFFAAYHNKLIESDTIGMSLYFSFHMHSRKTLESVTRYLDELLWQEKSIAEILEAGPATCIEGKDLLNRYVLSRLASELCLPLRISDEAWIDESKKAYEELEKKKSIVAKWEAWAYIVRIIGERAKRYRESGNYQKAAELTREGIQRCEDPDFPNINFEYGFQMLSMDLQVLVQKILNADTDNELANLAQDISDIDLIGDMDRANILYDLIGKAKILIELYDNPPATQVGRYKIDVSVENRPVIPAVFQVVDKARQRLDAYRITWKAREELSWPEKQLKFLLEASYIAKCHSGYVSLSEGTVGAALNRIGMFLQNGQEEMEQSANLRFFKRHPGLHLNEEQLSISLAYDDPYVNAFYVYRRIYHIKRGIQPYTSKVISELLLDGRIMLQEVHNDDGGGVSWRPVADVSGEWNRIFNESEVAFLQEATSRAYESMSNASAIPRIRFLNRQYLNRDSVGKYKHEKRECEELFRKEWERCEINQKLNKNGEFDYYCALLIPEYRPGWMNINNQWNMILNKMATLFENVLNQDEEIYQTGMRVLPHHIILAIHRMEIMRSFLSEDIASDHRWNAIFAYLQE